MGNCWQPDAMSPVEGGAPSKIHQVTMNLGNVRLIVAPQE
jgi:hypothetical protein